MNELINDIINHHYIGREHLLAEDLIKENKKFAEALYFELQMQIYLKDCDEQEAYEQETLFDIEE